MTPRATVRFLAAAAVAASMLVGASALPAGASAHRAVSADDCEVLTSVGDNIDTSGGGNIIGKQAQAIADGLDETAADISDKKLRKALQNMANFYDELAGAKNLLDAGKITVSEGRTYARAVKVFAKASLSCATASATLPSGVTLPGGVTLPNVTLPK